MVGICECLRWGLMVDWYAHIGMTSAQDNQRLVWIDLEMTGLKGHHVIIEIASIVTDSDLTVLAEGPDIAIKRSADDLANIDDWPARQHEASGLMDKVRGSNIGVHEAEDRTLRFIREWVDQGVAPLCGNSIWVDRLFLKREMPRLEAYLHYRIIDVSTVKELVARWLPDSPKQDPKENSHRALDDIRESISELRWYREHCFRG